MNRIERFMEVLESRKLDGFLVTSNLDFRYLSHFSGSAGYLWISSKRCVFMTDFRYETQAHQEVGDRAEIFIITNEKGYMDTIEELKLLKDAVYVGFDSECTSYNLYHRLATKFPNSHWIPLKQPVLDIRATKEPDEIEKIRRAGQIAIDALIEVRPLLKPGIIENEFAAELEHAMRKHGSERCAFDTIVASGFRAALPHGVASEKKIERGEMVVVDYGATYAGYASDITRTFFLGTPDEKFKTIYNTVLRAQENAIAGAHARMTGKEIDTIARDIIAEAGYGERFGHGLGHGLGLVVHDAPRVNQSNEKPIAENSVVTIEPGIYIPEWGGVRIEDDVVVGKDGVEILTLRLPKELDDIIIT